MATSNITGRVQRDAIARIPFGSPFSCTALDKSQSSLYSGHNMRQTGSRRISTSILSSFGYFWYWTRA